MRLLGAERFVRKVRGFLPLKKSERAEIGTDVPFSVWCDELEDRLVIDCPRILAGAPSDLEEKLRHRWFLVNRFIDITA